MDIPNKESSIEFDPSLVPDHVREEISRATLDLIKSILQQPGGREMLDARTAARKARQEAEQKAKKNAPSEMGA